MLSISRVLTDGTLLSLAMGAIIIASLVYNPRIWLQDYPEAVRKLVPPLNDAEKRAQRVMMVPFLLLFLVGPYLSTTALRAENGGLLPFAVAYLNTFLVLNIFNLFDAVVIDLLMLTVVKPRFMILPGTTLADYGWMYDWGMHLRNYLKGVVGAAVLALPITLVALL
jgi:hypothetical protein